jgi:transcriptional regulator with XRE-family HTH domain
MTTPKFRSAAALGRASVSHRVGEEHTRRQNLPLQAQLGEFLRNVRTHRGLTQHTVADAIGWRQPSYAELERGTRSTTDLRVWVTLAAVLQLGPEELLRKVWATRGSLPLALPPREDRRHGVLLKLAIEQADVDDVLLALKINEDSEGGRG